MKLNNARLFLQKSTLIGAEDRGKMMGTVGTVLQQPLGTVGTVGGQLKFRLSPLRTLKTLGFRPFGDSGDSYYNISSTRAHNAHARYVRTHGEKTQNNCPTVPNPPRGGVS